MCGSAGYDQVYEEDRLIENARQMGLLMKQQLSDLEARHPSVGAVRSLGLFGVVELCITEAQLQEAFAIIDRGLKIADRAVTG